MNRYTLLALLSFALIWTAPANAQDPAGCWLGTFAQTRGAFELERAGGGWNGQIHRLGGAVDSDPLTSAAIVGDSVHLDFPSSLGTQPATFAGRIDGTEMTGVIRSQGNELPVALQRADPSIVNPALNLVGYWNGGIEQGGAIVLRLGARVEPAPCGAVVASMDSPDQGATGVAIGTISVREDSVHFTVPSISGSFRGVVDGGYTEITGLWSQGPTTAPMSLTRSEGPIAVSRPQQPTPPYPYEEVDVSYENANAGVVLAGTLTLPPGDGPFPAALLLTGSGAQDRDESLMGHKPFLVIADYLTRRGIAVLRVDDRGVGGSTGNVMDATISDNVEDAALGVEYLRNHPRIDAERVGLIGHSEGGWVAPALAAESDEIAYVVMLAGPAAWPYELLLEQTRAITGAAGLSFVEERVDLSRLVLNIIQTEPDNERAMERIREAQETWLASLPPEARTALSAEIETPYTRRSSSSR